MRSVTRAKNFAKALVTRTLDFEFDRMPCRLENVSTTKILSVIESEFNRLAPRPHPPRYPVQLQIESSSACTLSCPLCASGMNAIDRRRGLMPLDTFKSIIDETGDHAVVAALWMYGEPFLNQQIFDMISYARSRNVAVAISTNGQHIQTKEDAEKLVSSGLDNLIVALDGATQESYGQYRVGGDINKIFRCMELIRQAKDSLGIEKPGVNVRTVVNKYNENELTEIEKIAHKYGANMISRISTHMPDYCGPDADRDFAPTNVFYQRFQYDGGKRIRRSINEYHCRRPWTRMSVTWDGVVVSCEHDFNLLYPFGRGGKGGSFLEAWRSQAAAAFRNQFLADKSKYPFCADCHFRDNKNECVVDMVRL